MDEVEVPQPEPTTYGWLSNLPLAASAGSVVYKAYEGSKNYNCFTQYALGTVESSVKMAASAVAPVVKRLDKPSKISCAITTLVYGFSFFLVHAVDTYTATKLIQLEEKVPAIKSQPEEVVTYISETKEALTSKVADGRAAVSTRISESKDAVAARINSGKEAVCATISASKEAIVNSRPGVAVSEGKQAIANHLAQGKASLSSTIASGRDAVYTRLQSGAGHLANTRAGAMVGSGVDCTLSATEGWVEYLLPEVQDEKELLAQSAGQQMVGLPLTRCPSEDSPAQAEEGEDPPQASRAERVCTLSRKVKLRMYYHSVSRLHTMQQNCKRTLEQLQQAVDLVSGGYTVGVCHSNGFPFFCTMYCSVASLHDQHV